MTAKKMGEGSAGGAATTTIDDIEPLGLSVCCLDKCTRNDWAGLEMDWGGTGRDGWSG